MTKKVRGDGLEGNGLPKALRLSGMEFIRVIAKGEKQSSPVCYAYFMAAEEFRSGISVSKKLGGAVVRNRVKRVLCEAVRLTKRTLSGPCHMVVVARQGAERLGLGEAKRVISELYAKSRVVAASRNG